MEGYLPRVLDRELDELLSTLPAVVIEGAKGVGKTRTASRRALLCGDSMTQRSERSHKPIRRESSMVSRRYSSTNGSAYPRSGTLCVAP